MASFLHTTTGTTGVTAVENKKRFADNTILEKYFGINHQETVSNFRRNQNESILIIAWFRIYVSSLSVFGLIILSLGYINTWDFNLFQIAHLNNRKRMLPKKLWLFASPVWNSDNYIFVTFFLVKKYQKIFRIILTHLVCSVWDNIYISQNHFFIVFNLKMIFMQFSFYKCKQFLFLFLVLISSVI